MAVLRIDQIHRLALACGGKELTVTGSGFTSTPVFCHWQPRLRLDHHSQCPIDGLTFHVPV